MGREDIMWKSRWTLQKFEVNHGIRGHWERGKTERNEVGLGLNLKLKDYAWWHLPLSHVSF